MATTIVEAGGSPAGQAPSSGEPRTTNVTRKNVQQDTPVEIKVEYPSFSLPDAGISAMLDKAIEAVVEREMRDVLTMHRAASAEDPELAKGWVLELTCRETMLGASYVSIVCWRFADTAGAHPSHQTFSLSYTWGGGSLRPLRVADLFEPASGWEKALEKLYTDELARQRAMWVQTGEFAMKPRDLHTWAITPQGLRIEFDPYDAGPYVEGGHTVLIPWSDLRPYLSPRSAVSDLLR